MRARLVGSNCWNQHLTFFLASAIFQSGACIDLEACSTKLYCTHARMCPPRCPILCQTWHLAPCYHTRRARWHCTSGR